MVQGNVAGNKKNIFHETPKEGNFGKSDWSLDRLKQMFQLYLDPCAMSKETSCCEHYFTPELDGLKQEWTENVFLNPPYNDIYTWLEKAMEEIANHDITVVALLPAYTGTKWWAEFVNKGAIITIEGRVHFWKDGKAIKGAPGFDSVIVIWGTGSKGEIEK